MKAKSSVCCDFAGVCVRLIAVACGVVLTAAVIFGQFKGFSAASIEPSSGVELTAGETVDVPVAVRIRRGYHINSDKPFESYLIPTKLSWESAPLTAETIEYPEAEEVTYSFSEKPLSVYSDRVVIKTRFKVPAAGVELTEIKGKFRFQACNDKSCLAPKTIDVVVPVRR